MLKRRRIAKHFTLAAGIVLLLTVAVLWSWNTLAGAIIPLGKLNYVQALAVVVVLGTAGLLLGRPARRHHAVREQVP